MNPKLTARGLKPASILGLRRDHGDRLRYMAGCRCDDCRRANTGYEKERSKARKAGDWNGIVPADKARTHLLSLSKKGMGRRAVNAVTDIADSALYEIRSGTRRSIRARTERLILEVTPDMASDHAVIPAKDTWALINKLLDRGYTKPQLAILLGRLTANLQIGRKSVLVITAHQVRRLYQKCADNNFLDAARRERLPQGIYSPKPGVLIHRMVG